MKILKVNMTESKIESIAVPEGKALGGRGMIIYLMNTLVLNTTLPTD